MITAEDIRTLGDSDRHGPMMVAMFPWSNFGFVWHGGAYIDQIVESSMGTFELNGKFYRYGDICINVWDYVKKEPTIRYGDKEALAFVINEFTGSK